MTSFLNSKLDPAGATTSSFCKEMKIPAYCPHCGLVFPSAFQSEGVETTVMIGNSERCPRCRGIASTFEGIIKLEGDVVEIIGAPDWSRDAFEKLRDLLEAGRNEGADRNAILDKIEELSPETAKLLRPFAKAGGAWWWVAGLIIFGMTRCELTVDGNRLVDQYFEHLAVQESKDLQQQRHEKSTDSAHGDPKPQAEPKK